MDLQGARAIVTGCASGIGAAGAAAVAGAGAAGGWSGLAGCAGADGAAWVAQLREAGARVVCIDLVDAPEADGSVCGDVGDEDAVVAGVSDAVAQLGGLDVAVLSAGVGGSAALLDVSTQEWDRVLNVNLRGAFVSLRECARAMTGVG